MDKSNQYPLGRRTFFKTSGLAIAGMSLPISGISQICTENESQKNQESLPNIRQQADYVVIGGGMAGVCSAITAARQGLKVILIQDRPVLGGNASSEIRLWILGATCHMGNNNRWSREGGVHEEIIVENIYRNKEGNPVIFDTLLIEKVWSVPNITLFLNTAVYNIEMSTLDKIGKVKAFCSQNATLYEFSAPYFCDASGDGIVGYLSGAIFRVGAETAEEFGEKFIMPPDFGRLLGHSMCFYTKDAGRPVKYIAPAFALKDIPGKIPRYKDIKRHSQGNDLWWLEWGDELDRVFDSEKIKDELWRVVYGVWDYIKNSGNFENVENLTLEWVNLIPGKRESRRFEGDYMLRQQDVVEQTHFDDAVAYGGWSIDLHPSTGVYSKYPGYMQCHSRGVYTIPYRCLYSRNISNLLFAGKIISASHIAFGSTRVISTGTLCGQASAMATVICKKYNISPREIYTKGYVKELQYILMQSGQYIPHVQLNQPADLIHAAKIVPSGVFELSELQEDGTWRKLNRDTAMLLPFSKGKIPKFTFVAQAEIPTTLTVSFYVSQRFGNYAPDLIMSTKDFQISAGNSLLEVDFNLTLKEAQYGFIVLKKNESISVAQSDIRLTGVLSLFYGWTQAQDNQLGKEEVPFYTPERRPGGKNLAMKITPSLKSFDIEQLRTGIFRPGSGTVNAWLAPLDDAAPSVKCEWKQPQTIRKIILWYDSDFDNSMESIQRGHPENVMPFCVQQYKVLNDRGQVIYETSENHHSRNEICLEQPVQTTSLTIQLYRTHKNVPVSLFGIQAFG